MQHRGKAVKCRQCCFTLTERAVQAGAGVGLAVGERSVTLLAPPSSSLLKRLLKGEVGAAE